MKVAGGHDMFILAGEIRAPVSLTAGRQNNSVLFADVGALGTLAKFGLDRELLLSSESCAASKKLKLY